MKLKRITVLAVLITAMVSLPVSAVSPAATSQVILERFSVPFDIPFGVPCADLPPGVTSVSGIAGVFSKDHVQSGQQWRYPSEYKRDCFRNRH